MELFHTHLPKLDDAGFVDWDPRTGAVVRGPRFDAVEPVLRLFADHTDELPSEWV
ncbi:hypothetical protein C453_17674 [Haloferax elongans ATCC BAA-1513]|uniref:DUF7344 domain-containing protein n=1 Tax=Haloferax elongans ATCC BAA-1513 TaxID=1230453 RepID=M0HFK2_HALEO|nr:hypothetical protein C453_17674 [Haloferax elongans ATCC BAA-1513]